MMTDPTARDHAPEGMEGAPEASASTSTDEAKIAALVETLARESADYKDKMLRALAEAENMRKRAERSVADARDYAITSFARDVLQVSDNMHRALEAIGPELRSSADGPVKALVDGVDLIEREFLKVLDKHGVKRFDPATGEKFDPNFHQAMFEVPDPTIPAGTVAQVMQAGYKIGERVLRPAMVGVAKGGPKATPPADPAPANDNAGAEDPPGAG
jgi:molecular chaperone GrpE